MKNNRLFGIIYLLLSHDTMTAKELALYFEVSVRTIYRDIDLLSSLNIPIYASKGKNGGISLLENYKLDKTLLTEEEQKEILFSLQSIDKLKINNSDLFMKMKNMFDTQEDDWFEIDFNIWNNSSLHQTNFTLLKKAIIECHLVEFTYFNSYGETSKRVVEPLKLQFKYNAWYLCAYEKAKDDFRFFKLMRINDLVVKDDCFARRSIPQKPVHVTCPPLIKVVLEINKSASYRVYDEFKTSSITKLNDGNFRVEVELPENDWLYGYILSFGNTAKVIAPTHLKNIILDKLKSSLERYQ